MGEKELQELAIEAYPVDMMYGGGQPPCDTNKQKREAFLKGFKFRQWLQDTHIIISDLPLHIKFRMYKNQEERKAQLYFDKINKQS